MQYPYWLMVAGAILVLAGLIGLGLTRNKDMESRSPEEPTSEEPQAIYARLHSFYRKWRSKAAP